MLQGGDLYREYFFVWACLLKTLPYHDLFLPFLRRRALAQWFVLGANLVSIG
jgi:hypothetical protein